MLIDKVGVLQKMFYVLFVHLAFFLKQEGKLKSSQCFAVFSFAEDCCVRKAACCKGFVFLYQKVVIHLRGHHF